MAFFRKMRLSYLLLFTLLWVIFTPSPVGADRAPWPFTPWPELKEGGFPPFTSADFLLHLSDERGYGESYFLQSFSPQGEILIVVLSVTNYNPLEKYAQSVDFYFAPLTGPAIIQHEEFKGKELKILEDGWVGMGPHRVRFTPEGGKIHLKGERLKSEIEFTNYDRPTRHGNGTLPFPKGRYWSLFLQAPWTVVRARLEGEIQREFEGYGYVDHGFATEMVPDFSQEWHRIRAYEPNQRWGISIFEIIPDKKYKNQTPFYTVAILKERKLKLLTSQCTLTHHNLETDRISGYKIPQGYRFEIKAEGVYLVGEIYDLKRRLTVDILASLNWFTRTVVKTFFANPWQYLSLGKTRISGEILGEQVDTLLDTMVSAEFYD